MPLVARVLGLGLHLEAERDLLGSCLRDDGVIGECVEVVSPGDFADPAHRDIWSAFLALKANGLEVDACSVAAYLVGSGSYHAIGGQFLGDLVDSIPHAANARYYAGIVREGSVTRRLVEACTETIADCYSRRKTACELLEDARRRIGSIEPWGCRRCGREPLGP